MSDRDGLATTPQDDGPAVIDLHEPIYREMAEPRDGYEPMPTWLVFLALALMGFGGWYLGTYSGGFAPDAYSESGGRPAAASAAAQPAAGVDPMVLGKRVYNNCMACHQRDGAGVAGNYPPLDGSDWVTGSPATLAAIVLHGLEGSVQVSGQTYNQVMPSWRHLTDEQIAAVLTYIRSSWGNDSPAVDPSLVRTVRDSTSDRGRPWRADELDATELNVES